MEVSVDSLREHIPYYLTQDQKEELEFLEIEKKAKQVAQKMFNYSPPGFSKVQEKAIARRKEYEEKKRLREEKRLEKLEKSKPET